MKTSKMEQMPVCKLLLNMGIPSVVSLMFSAVYNIVDSIFVSHMAENGEEALNALELAYPAQILIVALSIGTGAGALALLSRALGEKNEDKVHVTAGNALFLGGIIYIVCLLFRYVISQHCIYSFAYSSGSSMASVREWQTKLRNGLEWNLYKIHKMSIYGIVTDIVYGL